MEPDRHQTLQASLDLRLDPDSEAATPLQLRLLPLHHALLYRWPRIRGGGDRWRADSQAVSSKCGCGSP